MEKDFMKKEVTILIAEDDEGHAALIRRNFKRSGITNDILHFKDGQQILDFLFKRGKGKHMRRGIPYILLLDIHMPKVDGIEVLRQIKADNMLRKMPVTMITTSDDPNEIYNCHNIGCNNYITKPIDYDKFVQVIRQLSLFLLAVEVPKIDERVEVEG